VQEKQSRHTSLEEVSADSYWYTPEGITRRVEMLSQSFTYKMVNNSLIAYGKTYGIKRWRWITHPELAITHSCAYCIKQNGRVYRVGQFLPVLPAHIFCNCEWELMYDPEEIPGYVV